ncbi:MAG: TonB-dependent receptor [Opitutus sp.]|nr:TonB-dependent receptor [Opitutus sp.]
MANPHAPMATLRPVCDWVCVMIIFGAALAGHAASAAAVPPAGIGAQVEKHGNGRILGTVRHDVTGAYLEGAEVEVRSTRALVLVGRGGSFRLDGLPAGPTTLVASYAGLSSKTVEVEVPSAGVVHVDIALTSEIYAMNAFKVSEMREGNTKALTLQRNAMNPKEVVATDAFGNLSDGNVGELLVLLPGVVGEYVGSDVRTVGIRGFSPDLGSTTVDGATLANFEALGSTPPGGGRNFEFEAISADHIESVEVIKAPTPDLAASSIGGTVNLRTKSALDFSDKRRFRASVGATHQPVKDTLSANGNFSYSEVFGKERNLGVSLNYGYSNHFFPKEGTHIGFPTTTAVPNFMNLFRIYDQLRSRVRHGGGLKFDYRPNHRTDLFVNVLKSDFREDAGKRPDEGFRRLLVQTAANGSDVLPGFTDRRVEWRNSNNTTATQEIISAPKDQGTFQLSGGARHRWEGWNVDYDASFSRAVTTYNSGRYGLGQINPILRGIGIKLDRTETDESRPIFMQTSGPDIYNIDNYSAATTPFTQRDRRGVEKVLNGKVNFERSFPTVIPAKLKFGAAQQTRSRTSYLRDRRWTYLGPDGRAGSGDESVSRFALTDYFKPLLGGEYRAPRWVDSRAIHRALQANPGWFDEDLAFFETNNLSNAQDLEERILAGYTMATLNFGALTILAGARWERTENEGATNVNQITPAEAARRRAFAGPVTTEESLRRIRAQFASRIRATGTYQDIFPGLHLRYEPRAGLVLRGSYSTSVGRPNFGSIIPTTSADFVNEIVTTNNTDIGPQRGRALNAGLEFYPSHAGIVALNLFQTDLTDMIFTASSMVGAGQNNGFDGEYAGFELRTQQNGGSAKIRGVEGNLRQQLAWLPGFWKNFSVFANYTQLKASGTYGGSAAAPVTQLARFTPRSGSAGIAFSRRGLDVQVRATYKGESLFSYNVNPAARIYLRARTNVTLNLGYKINRNYRVYFDWSNIFDAFDPDYQYRTEQIRFNTPSGARMDFGVRYTL